MDCKGTHFFRKYNIYGIFFSLFRGFFVVLPFFLLIVFAKLFALFIVILLNY